MAIHTHNRFEPESPSDELTLLGLECALAISRNPASWARAAAWLQELPRCWHTSETHDVDHEALHDGRWFMRSPFSIGGRIEYVFDDEERFQRTWGPIARKLREGWDSATFPFRTRLHDRYFDFGEEDARRITLLAALIFNRDFDGAVLGFNPPWSFDQPVDSQSKFDGRAWAWSCIPSGPDNETCALIKRSLLYVNPTQSPDLQIEGPTPPSPPESFVSPMPDPWTHPPTFFGFTSIMMMYAALRSAVRSGLEHHAIARKNPDRPSFVTCPESYIASYEGAVAPYQMYVTHILDRVLRDFPEHEGNVAEIRLIINRLPLWPLTSESFERYERGFDRVVNLVCSVYRESGVPVGAAVPRERENGTKSWEWRWAEDSATEVKGIPKEGNWIGPLLVKDIANVIACGKTFRDVTARAEALDTRVIKISRGGYYIDIEPLPDHLSQSLRSKLKS